MRAFEYWLGVMRWRTGHSEIGRLERSQRATWGSYLKDAERHGIVSVGRQIITIAPDHEVAATEWADVQATLTAQKQSPLWYDLYFDGVAHLTEGDTRRTVIDFTGACEAILKTLLDSRLPHDVLPVARKRLLKLPAVALLNEFAKPLLGDERWSQLVLEDLRRLLEERNKVIHGHEHYLPRRDECRKFQVAVVRLLQVGMETME